MTNKQEIEKDFSDKSDTYFQKNYHDKNKGNFLRRLRNVLICDEIDKTKNVQKVLDVGCGPAILYQNALERCSTYYALDLVQSNLDQIVKIETSGKIQFIACDLDQFHWEKNYFDLVICSGSVEYTSEPANVLRSLIKSTKPGGKIICSFPNVYSPFRIWSEYVFRQIWILKNKLLKINYADYRRRLFGEEFIRKVFEIQGPVDYFSIRYFGVKLIPQPFDVLLSGLDAKILRHFENRPDRFGKRCAQEFLISFQKPIDRKTVN